MLKTTTKRLLKKCFLLGPIKMCSFNISNKISSSIVFYIDTCFPIKNYTETKVNASEDYSDVISQFKIINCFITKISKPHIVYKQHILKINLDSKASCIDKSQKLILHLTPEKISNFDYTQPKVFKSYFHEQSFQDLSKENYPSISSIKNQVRKCKDKNTNNDPENFDSSKDSNNKDDKNSDEQLPTLETLHLVQNHLNENMPGLLSEKHDYTIYHKEMEFVNNWSSENSYSTVGLMQYRLEMTKLKLYVHVNMTSVKLSLLRTTVDKHEGSVQVRWRISGVPHTTTIKQLLGSNQQEELDEWLDGFSTFYVKRDGLIWKHVMDKISPEGRVTKEGIMEKLARGITLSS